MCFAALVLRAGEVVCAVTCVRARVSMFAHLYAYLSVFFECFSLIVMIVIETESSFLAVYFDDLWICGRTLTNPSLCPLQVHPRYRTLYSGERRPEGRYRGGPEEVAPGLQGDLRRCIEVKRCRA